MIIFKDSMVSYTTVQWKYLKFITDDISSVWINQIASSSVKLYQLLHL